MFSLVSSRKSYGETLARLGESHKDIVVLDADISKSTCTYYFAERFPDRAFNLGVAEQNMMGVAAGLAACGKIPFVSTYAVFATMRACEQIRTMIAYPNLNVKIVVTHGGIATGWDGATHQGTEDIAMMRVIPNLAVISPADAISTEGLIAASLKYKGPMYIRLTRNPSPLIYDKGNKFIIGKANLIKDGFDITIIATGVMVAEALKAEEKLREKGISARILDMHTIKPIDKGAVVKAAKETGAVVTVEDHNIIGGLGGAVAEVLGKTKPVPLERIGLRDTFGQSGSPEALFKYYHLSADDIVRGVKKAIKRKDGKL